MAYLIWQLNKDSFDVEGYVEPDECQVWLLGQDGVNFETGPRFLYNPPYYGSVVIPPGGRADVMVVCFENYRFDVVAGNSEWTRNTTFINAPLPSVGDTAEQFVMHIIANGNISDIPDPIPCVDNPFNCTCQDWNIDELPCEPLPYMYSPYLEYTVDKRYPEVTSECTTSHDVNDMKFSL